MKNKTKFIISILSIILLFVILFIFTKEKTIKVTYTNDYYSPDTVLKANENTEFIIKGKFYSLLKEWNMHRDDDDLSKEHQYEFIKGKIYDFNIDEVLKGKIDSQSISVNLQYSTRLFFDSDTMLHGDEIKNSNHVGFIDYVDETYIEPQNNQEYILYLNYDKTFDVYYASFYPFMIEVNNQDLELLQNEIKNSYEVYELENKTVNVYSEDGVHTDFIDGMKLDEFKKLLK